MKKVNEKIKNYLRVSLLAKRKSRGSGFLFLPNSLKFKQILSILIIESISEHLSQKVLREFSDKLLISFVLSDLVNKKVIKKNGYTLEKYKVNQEIIYYDIYLKTYDNKIYCRGTNTDFATAVGKAVGEVMERTSILYPHKNENIFLKKVGEIIGDEKYLDFNKVAKPIDAQLQKFPEINISDTDTFEFVESQNLYSEGPVFLPKQLLYFGGSLNFEKKIIQSTTHAAGSGHTFSMALNSAFFEVVHRHFFLKSWYFKESPNQLNLESLNNSNRESDNFLYSKIKALENKGFKINILDFRNDTGGLPTFICILEKFDGWYCGGSTSLNLEYAIERSIDEAMSTYLWEVKQIQNRNFSLNKKYIDNIKSDFLDESLNARNRVLLFANSYFINKQDKFILDGAKTDLNDCKLIFDVDNFDVKVFSKIFFGEEVYFKNVKNELLESYNSNSVKMYISNSYYFPLSEMFARPILQDGKTPINTGLNPFP